MITGPVLGRLAELRDEDLPAYLYDLTALAEHVRGVRDCLPPEVELYYAAKANPAEPVLRVIARLATGVEIASGGELAHVRAAVPAARLAFGGPAKSPAEIRAALTAGVHRFHVESAHELRLLDSLAGEAGARPTVLLRVNFPLAQRGSLVMGGRPSQFGLDPDTAAGCLRDAAALPNIELAGLHAHLASGLAAPAQLDTAERVAAAARTLCHAVDVPLRELNLGGGMGVDYAEPDKTFDWPAFGAGLRELAGTLPGTTLRVEPGRSLAAYCGWYAATVADVKHSAGNAFALIRGGTHHFRTPAAKGHSHPFQIIHCGQWAHPWPRPAARRERVTVAGQLCTPKDVLASQVPVDELRAGDRIVFELAGAYAWNISHHEFLMHPRPAFHYL